MLFEIEWIADFQTAPTGQFRESDVIRNNQSYIRKLYTEIFDITYRQTLSATKAVITLSNELVNRLHTDYEVSREKITLVPLGVDTERFDPKSFESTCFVSDPVDSIHLIYLGSIVSHRGLDTCIDALAMRSQLHQPVVFHIVGDGPDDAVKTLQRQARLQNIDERIVWHGYINHNDVPEILSKMDIAVSPLPAYDSYEVSSPAKLYEYLAMDLPIICSDIQPHRDLLTSGTTGFFFDPEVAESLLNALNHAISNHEANTASQYGECRAVASDHDWETRIDTIKTVVES